MHLTESWLRQHCSAITFERAEAYFEANHIRKVIRVDDLYRAEVKGSKLYRQVLDLSREPPALTCTCPFSGGGYCKHLIAVGLAILAGDYADASPMVVAPRSEAAVDPALLEQVWTELPPAMQMRFLRQALNQDPSLQQAYLRYARAKVPPELVVDRRRVQAQLSEALDQVDLASLDLDWVPEAIEVAEVPSWEDSEESLRLQLDRVLTPFSQRMKALLQDHNWPNGLLLMLGCHEGKEQARLRRLPEWEPWAETLDEALQPMFHRLVDGIAQEILPARLAIWGLQTWFERWQFCEQHLKLNRPTHSIRYRLDEWRLLLQVLTQDRSTAQFMRTRLDAYQLQGPGAADLYAHLDRIEAQS
jgi:hypothetical protein